MRWSEQTEAGLWYARAQRGDPGTEASDESQSFVPTIGRRGERHPTGLVGRIFVIRRPSTVHVGNCFMAGRLRVGDVVLCTGHGGDCFQGYRFLQVYANCLLPTEYTFSSYGIGDAYRKWVCSPDELVRLRTAEAPGIRWDPVTLSVKTLQQRTLDALAETP